MLKMTGKILEIFSKMYLMRRKISYIAYVTNQTNNIDVNQYNEKKQNKHFMHLDTISKYLPSNKFYG